MAKAAKRKTEVKKPRERIIWARRVVRAGRGLSLEDFEHLRSAGFKLVRKPEAR
jgi:hypothetical protein